MNALDLPDFTSNSICQILVYFLKDWCQTYTLRLSISNNFFSQNFILHTVHHLEIWNIYRYYCPLFRVLSSTRSICQIFPSMCTSMCTHAYISWIIYIKNDSRLLYIKNLKEFFKSFRWKFHLNDNVKKKRRFT